MSEIAEAAPWVALIATCLAALMTASNLGSRVTGWGFVIFTLGALAWVLVGAATGQTQLLYSNCFLAIVDVFGVWRWLGRQAHDDEVSNAEVSRGELKDRQLFSIAKLDGLSIKSCDGQICGHAVDALIACANGKIDHLLVRVDGFGGLGKTLRRLPWNVTQIADGEIRTSLPCGAFERLEAAEAD